MAGVGHNDDHSSSSDSDEEYLTQGTGGVGGTDSRFTGADREALVRKKLLENFYGKSAVGTQDDNANNNDDDDDDDSSDDDDDDNNDVMKGSSSSAAAAANTDNIDSPQFDAQAHARKHIEQSSLHNCLQVEERLALQVRTLDTTMQTMVYENYSRFIDATDAIRSIGVNVQANEAGLKRLTASMTTVDATSKGIEDALGSLRDQVAEKIRVKRLLTRLDALLKLPQTLQDQIKKGKYRTATKRYLEASSILSKHSQGFESLQKIEMECNSILVQLKQDLKRKLLHWSGRLTPYDEHSHLGTYSDDDDYNNTDNMDHDMNPDHDNNNHTNAPNPPKNMTEVFECAGTLFILQDDDSELTPDDLQSMAISASMRFLDRLLDSHLIQVQERRFASGTMIHAPMVPANLRSPTIAAAAAATLEAAKPPGSALIPREFLDAVLEGASLYGMSFGGTAADHNNATTSYLMEFVVEAYSSFLSHVRSILYEESMEANRNVGDEVEEDGDGEAHDENGAPNTHAAYAEISSALTLLVQYVRELASGLALPEVGINADYAAKMVDQAMQLTESMVRRRVDQKFYDLRLSVVRDCLLPFANRAVKERQHAIQDEKPVFAQIVQIASNTLSDCLQLVDDTIRSIFSGGLVDSNGDLPDLKDAVYASTYRFASWLANAFEILAGGDSTDPKRITEAALPVSDAKETADSAQVDDMEGLEIQSTAGNHDDMSDIGGASERELVEMMDEARAKLENSESNDGSVHPDFILSIAELCRLSKASVPENLDQSIAAHAGGGKKKSRGLFPNTNDGQQTKDDEDDIAARFQLASSRVLVLYATNSGVDAGNILCRDLRDVAMKAEDDIPVAPRDCAWEVLKLAKEVSIQCFNIFGGNKRAGPVPKWENDSYGGLSNPLLSRKTGLQLDVERMFKERITIYPHPSETLESSRNAVLFLFFRIAFRALLENARMLTFTISGASQLQVDIEFLKHMVPHYVSSDFAAKSTNACTALSNMLNDVTEVVEERLEDGNYIDREELKGESREVVMSFLANAEDDGLADEFVISED